MPKTWEDPYWRLFKGKTYEVVLEETPAAFLAKLGQTRRLLAEAIVRRLEMLSQFPPEDGHWSRPLVSFESGIAHHALVSAQNMAVEITAHYRMDSRCVVVSLRPTDS